MAGLKNVRNRRDDALTRVSWDRLEAMLANHYRSQGWQVEHVGTGSGRTRFDGGIDLKLRKGDEYVLVQSKHWNAKQVTHNAVHELLGIKVNENATGAIVITSGEFTQAALQAATRQNHVQLIDGDALRLMLGPQLDGIAASVPPPLPTGTRQSRKHQPLSADKKVAALVVALFLALLFLYAAYRLLTMPILTRPIVVDLPNRTGAAPRKPVQPAYKPPAPVQQPVMEQPPIVERPPIVEQGTSDEELEEWKRKNAESMRILEENERREEEAAASD